MKIRQIGPPHDSENWDPSRTRRKGPITSNTKASVAITAIMEPGTGDHHHHHHPKPAKKNKKGNTKQKSVLQLSQASELSPRVNISVAEPSKAPTTTSSYRPRSHGSGEVEDHVLSSVHTIISCEDHDSAVSSKRQGTKPQTQRPPPKHFLASLLTQPFQSRTILFSKMSANISHVDRIFLDSSTNCYPPRHCPV